MSAPLVINLKDGSVWERRAVSPDGVALYALAESCQCPEFLMATEAELAAMGIAGSADVLPMPAGPGSEPLSPEQVEALAAAGNRAVNDAVHEDLCMCDAWPEKCLSSGGFFQGYWDVGSMETAVPAVVALWESMRGGELEGLRARVAELEAERHVTNAALDDAVQALRIHRDRTAALAERLRAGQTWQRGRSPELVSENYVSQSELRAIFGIPLTAPWADGITRQIVPVQALREDEPTVKCRCDEPDADPYSCEAEDCTHEFSELNPFGGGSGPVEGHDAKVFRVCGCGWPTSIWHVADGSAEAELHAHVVRVHGGVYPAESGGGS
ncbi:hypothetical protein [Streptomyces sp. NBC_01373]|uniref:hypothetical protein n=1 Tax=Streptomyces sp. NBC_01373 TaxID=2903843 RepID=UPI0022571094|nr:hypothetical protein [Streptomyces sp. NBC_01373]MCX4703931.1 hypothetical protein [Streptomyces sp. NBC_01373]